MPLPFYVSPEQMVQDKAEYARKGIAKGKSIIAMEYEDGIILTAENPSTSLNKISEIYDRIAFAGVGKYSEFENLRKVGIRYADMKGYIYSREDVTAKSLGNAYSQAISTIFTQEIKPLEVEILVVEVGDDKNSNAIYHISFDGTITDYKGFVVIGGQSERIKVYLQEHYKENLPLVEALRLCRDALSRTGIETPGHEINLEVAILDRRRKGRKFKRLSREEIRALLGEPQGPK